MSDRHSPKRTRFAAVVSVKGNDKERILALRKACKRLLRDWGIRIIELRPLASDTNTW